ncbi:MAG: hypothetical protein NTX16_08680 [Actinobacteria bacterium]|nr:hypothetical protein [Actinomycetota bacterium]
MHNVTVVCQGCGNEFTYQTMFISTVGVAVCPCCGVRDGAATPRGTRTSPLDMEGHIASELTSPPAQERAA